ncbi:PTS sugar transporter subunit IIB [Salmonella enterica]|nr:PTS sugar transporter subunit IIB [Salmonella enterica subsp. enterica serovar Schwarzengrund]EDR4631109.1 PTS sugar transporter subunit IIB [Salmonella enterica subsp. enterica serovar 4,[5],12:i:-]
MAIFLLVTNPLVAVALVRSVLPFSSLNVLNNFADYTCNFSGDTR